MTVSTSGCFSIQSKSSCQRLPGSRLACARFVQASLDYEDHVLGSVMVGSPNVHSCFPNMPPRIASHRHEVRQSPSWHAVATQEAGASIRTKGCLLAHAASSLASFLPHAQSVAPLTCPLRSICQRRTTASIAISFCRIQSCRRVGLDTLPVEYTNTYLEFEWLSAYQ